MVCSSASVTDRRGDLRNLCFCRVSLPMLNALTSPYDTHLTGCSFKQKPYSRFLADCTRNVKHHEITDTDSQSRHFL